jgi:hypothetical protein
MTTIIINGNEYSINSKDQIIDPSNSKVAVAITQIPDEDDQEYWGDHLDWNPKYLKAKSYEKHDLKCSEYFTNPQLIKALIEFQSLSEEKKEREQRSLNTDSLSYYLESGFFHLDIVWIKSNQYIQIYNCDEDYIQKYNISKEYKKGFFKLFDI